MQPGHIVSDAPGVIGCFGSYIRHPHPGNPARGDQATTCVQVVHCYTCAPSLTRATMKPFQQLPRCSWWLFACAVRKSLRVPGPGVETSLQSPCSPLQQAYSGPFSCSYDTQLPDQHTWPSSFPGLPPLDLPRGQLIQVAPPACLLRTSRLCLVGVT